MGEQRKGIEVRVGSTEKVTHKLNPEVEVWVRIRLWAVWKRMLRWGGKWFFNSVYYRLNCMLPNAYVEVLNVNVTVFGDRALKVKWGHRADSYSSLCTHTEGRPWEDTDGMATICKPGKKVSSDSSHAGTLILDFRLPDLWKNKFLPCKLPHLWYFVMPPWAD